jgi:hypothetical protein
MSPSDLRIEEYMEMTPWEIAVIKKMAIKEKVRLA